LLYPKFEPTQPESIQLTRASGPTELNCEGQLTEQCSMPEKSQEWSGLVGSESDFVQVGQDLRMWLKAGPRLAS